MKSKVDFHEQTMLQAEQVGELSVKIRDAMTVAERGEAVSQESYEALEDAIRDDWIGCTMAVRTTFQVCEDRFFSDQAILWIGKLLDAIDYGFSKQPESVRQAHQACMQDIDAAAAERAEAVLMRDYDDSPMERT